MTKISDIDPLGSDISMERAQELGQLCDRTADTFALTVRQKRDLERLLTSAYIAGRLDVESANV